MARRESYSVSFYLQDDPDGEPIHEFTFWELSPVILHQPGERVRLVADIQQWTGEGPVDSGEWERLQDLDQFYEVVRIESVSYWEVDKITHGTSVSVEYVVRPIQEGESNG